MSTPQAYKEAERFVGLTEIVGSRHEPKIVGFFAEAGVPEVVDDETAWCGAFAAAMYVRAGRPDVRPPGDRYNALRARQWANVGIETASPVTGDLVVMWRGSREGSTGHVGFFVRRDDKKVWVLGGNQSNAVSIQPYGLDRVLHYRHVPEIGIEGPPPSTAKDLTVVGGAGAAGVATMKLGEAIWNAFGWLGLAVFIVAVLGAIWMLRKPLGKLIARRKRNATVSTTEVDIQ